jgi:hypothetical protein
MWLNRLPEKLDEKLENVCLGTRPDGGLILGRGVVVIEGLHKQRISRLTTDIVALSIVISVAYSASMKDTSSAFAISGLLVGCWSLFIQSLAKSASSPFAQKKCKHRPPHHFWR